MSLSIEENFSVIDWNDLTTNRSKFVDDVFEAFKENGLLFIKNAPLAKMRDQMEEAAEAFFKNAQDLKNRLVVPGNDNEGYFVPKKGDYKEYFHLGRHTYKALADDQIKDLPDFAHDQAEKLKISHHYFVKTAMEYSDLGVEMGDAIMTVLEEKLGLEKGELTSLTLDGNHIARFLNYFPQDELTAKKQEGLVRAKAHTDVCALTFLPPSKVAGLQVLKKQDLATAFKPKQYLRSGYRKWIDVPYIDNTVVCNIGSSASVKLNGLLPPTAHCVRNPSAEDALKPRIAMPIFYHFNENMNLGPLEKTVEARDGVNLFPNAKNITLKDYAEAPDVSSEICNDFHPNRQVSEPGEHPSVSLERMMANTL